jgi:hypothetical protein
MDLRMENAMPLSKFFMFSALAGTAAALFVAARRQIERAEAIKDRVKVQDWESAPVKPAARGAQIPPPEEIAEKVTGIPNAVSEALTK